MRERDFFISHRLNLRNYVTGGEGDIMNYEGKYEANATALAVRAFYDDPGYKHVRDSIFIST